MKDESQMSPDEQHETQSFAKASYSRRQFLKMAGIAGAAVGMGAGLGGLLAACGEETTETTGSTTATTGGTETTGGESTTSVSASGETGDEIKVGVVSSITGSYAAFGKPDKYLVEHWMESVADGLLCGDGKIHPIKIIHEDTQSNSNRAGQVTGDLIANSGVKFILAGGGGSDTGTPAADQAEALGVPSFTTDVIWQAWFNGRGAPEEGFKWTYHAFWGVDDMIAMYFAMWSNVPNNKTYGALWPNDADGNTYRKMYPPVLEKNGWKLIDPGAFNDGNEDYSSIIDAFKSGGVEVCAGLMTPADFTNFWKQCKQQNWSPKICSVGKALNFPEAATSLGQDAYGLTGPFYWHPAFPYKSSITGETAAELAADYEAKTGNQWTQALNHYIMFEVFVDTFKRTTDPDDPESILAALSTTKLDTIQGPLDFTAPVAAGTVHPIKNACRVPIIGGQWVKGTGKWTHEVNIVSNANFEDIPLGEPMTSLI